MALGEEKAEAEASAGAKAQSYRRWSCGEREGDTPGPVIREQSPHLEAEGVPISPVWGAEGPPAPACWAGADPGSSLGAYQPQASDANKELVADGLKPTPHCLLHPANTGTGGLLCSVGSQMEETKLSASGEPPQTLRLPGTTALCSVHDADTEDNPSPLDLPQVLDLSQRPHSSGFPFPSQLKSMVSPGAAAPQLSSCSISASSTGSSLQDRQEKDSAREGSLVSSQALGISSGLLKTHPSLPAVLDQWPFSDPSAEGQLPRRGEQGKESLVQCVKTFCCQLEELIRWLYNVVDITDHGTPPRSNLTGLKSSLQLYRQFKKDIDEHQSLTESVLQKGEILLQCLLDNTPVLKDVLGRIAKQSGELESHAERLYDSILVSLDMLAGCTLIPDKKPMAAEQCPCEGV
nr:centrosomal protein of 68 kDa isoform X3 [Microcebus murinus]